MHQLFNEYHEPEFIIQWYHKEAKHCSASGNALALFDITEWWIMVQYSYVKVHWGWCSVSYTLMEDAVNFGPKYPIIQYCVAVDDKFCYMDTLGIGLCACILSEAGASTRYLSRVYL